MAFSTHSILPTHASRVDCNADGLTDLLWTGPAGTVAVWCMSADGMSFTPGVYVQPPAGLVLRGVGDVSGGGTTDLIWQDAAGAISVGFVGKDQVSISYISTAGAVEAVGEFNRDGHADVLTHYSNGTWMAESAEGRKIPPPGLGIIAPFSAEYHLTTAADFDGDGRTDILFRGTGEHAGDMLLQLPVSVFDRFNTLETAPSHIADPGPDWNVLGTGDFNGDGSADLLWQYDSGMRCMWFGSGGTFRDGGALPDPGPDWSVVGTGDYNNDGYSDLMWRSASQPGLHVEWLLHGTSAVCGAAFNVGAEWALG